MSASELARTLSVVIPAYKAQATIARALASIAAQDVTPAEVIVVDDGSSDGTAAAAEAGAGSLPLRLIRLPRNGGESVAMNAGIEVATGALIAFLDADDEWLPAKLAHQLPLMADGAVAFSSTGHVEVDGRTGVEIDRSGCDPLRHGPDEFWRNLLRRSVVAKPTVIARRDALLGAGLFDPRLAIAGDQDMWLKLALGGRVMHLPQPLLTVHDMPDSLMHRAARADLRFTIPMMERFLKLAGNRLTEAEKRAVLAERWTRAAANLAGAGDWGLAVGAELTARGLGGGSFANLQRLAASVPIVRRLRGRAAPRAAAVR